MTLLVTAGLAASAVGPVGGASDDGVRLELMLFAKPGEAARLEVRLHNVGSKTWVVNRRFAYAGKGNPLAELTFEATPPSSLGCRFNVKQPVVADYTLLRPGELVGRTFEAEALECFASNADTVTVHAFYKDKGTGPRPRGPALATELVSNDVVVRGALIRPTH